MIPNLAMTFSRALFQGAPKTAGQLSLRPYSTVARPTTFDPSGKLLDAGHIQFQTTLEEQAKYGVAPAYGHSPAPSGPSTLRPVSGELPSGQKFSVIGVEKPAKPAHLDVPIPITPKTIVVKHGELTKELAEKLKTFKFPAIYETSGAKRSNCVHAHAKLTDTLFGTKLSPAPLHETPDQLAQRIQSELSTKSI